MHTKVRMYIEELKTEVTPGIFGMDFFIGISNGLLFFAKIFISNTPNGLFTLEMNRRQ
jgi:hypothetical protein